MSKQCVVVYDHTELQYLRQSFSPETYIVVVGQAVLGQQFSAIVVTRDAEDLISRVDIAWRWWNENISCRLIPDAGIPQIDKAY